MKNLRFNKNQKPIFVQTIIASSILSLSIMNHAAAWTINHGAEHDSDTTTVEKGETAAKIDAYQSDAPNIVAGEMNRGGNPARLVWYGKSSDADGHTAQNKANNQGYIWGRVIAQGTDSETKDEKNSSIQVEAQGNAIDAMGWTAPTNYHDVIMNIQKITNDGVAIGEADLKGGLGSVHGRVETFGSANGISILGATDWGNSTIDGTSGATGKSSSASVGTMTTTTRKPNDFRKPGSQGTGYDSDKQLTSEINGKTVQVLVGDLNQNNQNVIENNGLLRGELKAVTNQEITNPVTDEDYPQFFGTKSGASGNGISVASLVSSVNKQGDSSEKYNYAMINGLIDNKGTVEGLATVKGGSNTTWTQTSSVATGNGISVFAQTRSPANSKTAAFMSGLNNDGKIIGQLQQISGNNSINKNSIVNSTATTFSSGNGVSVHTDTFGIIGAKQIPITQIGNVQNNGKIAGTAYVQAGSGNGNMGVEVRSSGNGISANNYGGGKAFIGNIKNDGVIVGHVETHAGIGAGAAKKGSSIPTKETLFAVYFDGTKTSSDKYNYWNGLPNQSENAASLSNHQSLQAGVGNYKAESMVIASGNGISGYQGNRTGTDTATDGATFGKVENNKIVYSKIDNGGVISGYAKMYHGIIPNNQNVYQPVHFLSVGTGISADRVLDKDNIINNRGIISGNHAAMLFKGIYDDRTSNWWDSSSTYKTGYVGKVNNYGLMAGVLIAGNYRPMTQNLSSQTGQYQYYYNTATDPINNLGTYVYLKRASDKNYQYGSTTFYDDYETIDRVVQGKGGTFTAENGQTYTVINGNLSTDKKDSAYDFSGSLKDSIVNGAGVATGALNVHSGSLKLENSVINGYVNALKLGSNTSATLTDSTINSNGFQVRTKLANNEYGYTKPLAISGSTGAETLTLDGNTRVNGDIHLGDGDDILNIQNANVRFNGNQIDLGAGNNQFNLSSGTDDKPVTVDYTVQNANTMSVSGTAKLAYDAKIRGIHHLTMNQGSRLIYQVADPLPESSDDLNGQKQIALNEKTQEIATHHAFYDKNGSGSLKIDGEGEIILDTARATDRIDLGGFQLESTPTANAATAPNVIGKVKYSASNVLQYVSVEDGDWVIKTKTAVAPSPVEPVKPSETAKPTEPVERTKPTEPAKPVESTNQTTPSNNIFVTPYADAYNSLSTALARKNLNMANVLKNSSATLTQTDSEAMAAVNEYFNQLVNNNIYPKTIQAANDSNRAYHTNLLDNNARLLKQGETETKLTGFNEKSDETRTSVALLSLSHGVSDQFTVGAAVGAGSESVSASRLGSLKGHSVFGSIFAVNRVGETPLTFKSGLSYGNYKVDGTRYTSNGLDSHAFKNKVKLSIASLFTQATYQIPLTANLSIEPKVGISLNRIKLGAISEEGSNDGSIQVASKTIHTVDTNAGANLVLSQPIGTGKLTGKLSLDYLHTTSNTRLTASFQDGGTPFTLNGLDSRNAIKTSVRVGYETVGGASIQLGVGNTRRSGNSNSWNAQLGLGYKF